MAHVRDKRGFNLAQSQHAVVPAGHETLTLSIPTDNQAAFNSQTRVTIREKQIIIDSLTLEVSVSSITGTSGSPAASWAPATFWISRLDVLSGTKVLDTYYPEEMWISSQLDRNDEGRAFYNRSIGSYSDLSARQVDATMNTTYFVELNTFFKTAKIPLISTEDIMLRIFWKPLEQCCTFAGGVPAASIQSCQLLARVGKPSKADMSALAMSIARVPRDYAFSELKNQQYTVSSGVTSHRQVLSGIVGPVSELFFIVRSAPTTGTGVLTFTSIASFEVLSGGSTNIVGGTAISANRSRLLHGRHHSLSSYLTESGANVYLYSWGFDNQHTNNHGASTGEYAFQGNEVLVINFNTATGSQLTVDVFAMVHAALRASGAGISKISG